MKKVLLSIFILVAMTGAAMAQTHKPAGHHKRHHHKVKHHHHGPAHHPVSH